MQKVRLRVPLGDLPLGKWRKQDRAEGLIDAGCDSRQLILGFYGAIWIESILLSCPKLRQRGQDIASLNQPITDCGKPAEGETHPRG